MPKPLMPVGELFSQSWRLYKDNMKKLMQISAWTILIALGFIAINILLVVTQSELPRSLPFRIGMSVIEYVLLWWVSIRLTRFCLAKDAGRDIEPNESSFAWSFLPSFLLIMVLTLITSAVGFVLLIVPGIWISHLLGFSMFLMLEDGIKGTKALSASATLVKGRWFPSFGRLILPGLILVGVVFMMYIVMAIGFMLGIGGAAFLSNTGGGEIVMIALGILVFLIMIAFYLAILLVWTPFYMVYITKLFHNMKATQDATAIAR